MSGVCLENKSSVLNVHVANKSFEKNDTVMLYRYHIVLVSFGLRQYHYVYHTCINACGSTPSYLYMMM